jgi:cyanophycin synthetase
VGVLNGNDPRIASLAELCDGEVLFYAQVGEEGLPEAVSDHLAEGGRAALLKGGRVVLAHGSSGANEVFSLDLEGILRRRGRSDAAALKEALLAAVATAWAFGISPELIAAGVETFDFDLAH